MREYFVTFHIHLTVEAPDNESAELRAHEQLSRIAANGDILDYVSDYADVEGSTNVG
jgi:hypothetical protein